MGHCENVILRNSLIIEILVLQESKIEFAICSKDVVEWEEHNQYVVWEQVYKHVPWIYKNSNRSKGFNEVGKSKRLKFFLNSVGSFWNETLSQISYQKESKIVRTYQLTFRSWSHHSTYHLISFSFVYILACFTIICFPSK